MARHCLKKKKLNPKTFFTEIKKTKTANGTTKNPEQPKVKARGITLPDFKTYYAKLQQ
jgi:hypothetical protein